MNQRPTVLSDIIRELVGCEWGRNIRTADDDEPCNEQAHNIIVLHEGKASMPFKLCARHRDRVLAETTPHKENDQQQTAE